jgi:hypothetical protein
MAHLDLFALMTDFCVMRGRAHLELVLGVEILASFSQSPQSQGYPMKNERQKMSAFCLPNLPTGDSLAAPLSARMEFPP